MMASKRRCKINLLSLSFVSKIISKSLVIKFIAKLLFLLRVARTNLPSGKLALMQVAGFFANISPRVFIAGAGRSKLV